MTQAKTDLLSAAKPSSRWFNLAEELQSKLRNVGPGSRELAISKFGEEHKLKIGTLRAYLIAWRQIEKMAVEEPALARALKTASADAVAALARWSQYDTMGYMEAAQRIAAGTMSISQVKRAAVAARGDETRGSPRLTFVSNVLKRQALYWPQSSNFSTLDDKEAAWKRYIPIDEDWVKFANDAYFMGGDLMLSPSEISHNHRVDVFAGEESNKSRRVAIIIVGPYKLDEYYDKLHVDWLLRAIGVAHFYKNVALFLPSGGLVRPFQKWLRQYDPEEKLRIFLVRERADGTFQAVRRDDVDETPTNREVEVPLEEGEDYWAISSGFQV